MSAARNLPSSSEPNKDISVARYQRVDYLDSVRQKPFPWGVLLLLTALTAAALFYFPSTRKEYMMPAVRYVSQTLGGLLPGKWRAYLSFNSHGDPAEGYVLIEGKWYKKTDDNTYIINGKKILFMDNRRPVSD